MKLEEIFNQLSTGEFSQISIGGLDLGVINESNYAPVVAHLNMGLAALYRRFPLKESVLTLQVQEGQLTYPLRSEFAVNNRRSRQPVRYIIDSAEAPFSDDINKIERILTSEGIELDLNNKDNPLGCTTPSMQTLVIPKLLANQTGETPYWLRTETLEVHYRAAHPVLSIGLGLFDPARIEVELPYTHLEALLYYVASRVNNPIGLGQEFNAGNTYAAKYEAACRELETLGMRIDTQSQPNRLRQKGFV